MSKNKNIFDDLKPLERAQYIGLLKHIDRNFTIFGKWNSGELKPRELGLTLSQLKTAMNRLADSGLIAIEEDVDIVAFLTDLGKKHLEKESKEK